MSKKLVFDQERKAEADRQYDICRLEALMMDLETQAMFPDVDDEPEAATEDGGRHE